MPAPYSNDLRQKVIEAHANQEGSMAKLARRFRVSLGFIKNLLQRYRQTGSVAPRPHGGGHPPIFTPARQERLRHHVEQHPDATLVELRRWSRLDCCLETVSQTLIRMGLGRKKNATASRAGPPGCAGGAHFVSGEDGGGESRSVRVRG